MFTELEVNLRTRFLCDLATKTIGIHGGSESACGSLDGVSNVHVISTQQLRRAGEAATRRSA